MRADSIAVIAAVAVAAVLFVVYLVASRLERGNGPHYGREVYLFRDSPRGPLVAAAALGAVVATPAQVGVYAESGGDAPWYGVAHGGEPDGALVGLVSVGGKRAVARHAGRSPPRNSGVWLYGPKPRRGTPGVVPFSRTAWFHP